MAVSQTPVTSLHEQSAATTHIPAALIDASNTFSQAPATHAHGFTNAQRLMPPGGYVGKSKPRKNCWRILTLFKKGIIRIFTLTLGTKDKLGANDDDGD